jgi:nucleoid-associated protein YgaU
MIMAIYRTSSRYRLSNGGRLADRVPYESVTYYQYVTREKDTFSRIAARVLNDPTRYWEIADINPQVEWPDAIPTGTVLRIPS